MPIRDAKTPAPTELDRLAEITPEDIDDAERSLTQRVPQAKRAVEATRDDSTADGPTPDGQTPD